MHMSMTIFVSGCKKNGVHFRLLLHSTTSYTKVQPCSELIAQSGQKNLTSFSYSLWSTMTPFPSPYLVYVHALLALPCFIYCNSASGTHLRQVVIIKLTIFIIHTVYHR